MIRESSGRNLLGRIDGSGDDRARLHPREDLAHALTGYVAARRLDFPNGSPHALRKVMDVPVLALDDDIRGLARIFVREKVMPGPLAGDAIHLAAECLDEMEYLPSWNVRHLANPNKLEHVRKVCLRLGVLPPRIVTPDLLWETDDDGP